jgi:hypothetical protein
MDYCWTRIKRTERRKEREIKGKAIPVQAWIGPEGSRIVRLPDFRTIGT